MAPKPRSRHVGMHSKQRPSLASTSSFSNSPGLVFRHCRLERNGLQAFRQDGSIWSCADGKALSPGAHPSSSVAYGSASDRSETSSAMHTVAHRGTRSSQAVWTCTLAFDSCRLADGQGYKPAAHIDSVLPSRFWLQMPCTRPADAECHAGLAGRVLGLTAWQW